MTEAFATVNGQPVAKLSLHVPARGAWFVALSLEDDAGPAAGELVTLVIAGAVLRGRALPSFAGTFGLQRKMHIVGGNASWGSLIGGAKYHNDVGVKAESVARDAAAATGENIGTFQVDRSLVGVDFIRRAGEASRALDHVIGSSLWYVDYDGVTRVVPTRAGTTAPADAYEVLEYDPKTHVAVLAVDDMRIGVGSIISARLDLQETIQSFDLELDGSKLRMTANCGATLDATTQLEVLFTRIVERIAEKRLRGPFRYRVIATNSDGRVSLQAVSARAGVPDAVLVEQWGGMPGMKADLTPGAIVIVQFADDGDPSLPMITGYRGQQDEASVAKHMSIAGGGQSLARQGDTCQGGGPGTVVTFTPVVPAPGDPNMKAGLPYLISFSLIPPTPILADPLYSVISTGSQKVDSG